MYLIPNVTALIQPMDQGVIFKRNLMKELICYEKEGGSGSRSVDLIKLENMKSCCLRIAEAWNQVNPLNLQNAWNKVLNRERSYIEQIDFVGQFHFSLQMIPGYKDYSYDKIKNWVSEDFDDHGWGILDVNQIIDK